MRHLFLFIVLLRNRFFQGEEKKTPFARDDGWYESQFGELVN